MAQFDVHRNSGKHKDTIPFSDESQVIIGALDELLSRAWK